MADYKIAQNGVSIMRVADGAQIPSDPKNSDYKEFLVWQEQGNVPDTADEAPAVVTTPDLATQLATALLAKGALTASDFLPDTLASVTLEAQAAGVKS